MSKDNEPILTRLANIESKLDRICDAIERFSEFILEVSPSEAEKAIEELEGTSLDDNR